MPADRDRLSFDPNQVYRSVVAQQGRVTLAADFNEAQEIAAEENREQLIDIVGPVGTPDDGYAISFPGGRNLGFSAGTMYTGGIRTESNGFTYTTQPDWLTPDPLNTTLQREYIFLTVEEREISAVEDSTLREVALGGPDTTQRLRMLQRANRVATTANDCPAALAAQITAWQQQGWSFQPSTMMLKSVARLQVSFATTGASPDPCEPAATGGFLGAENQLIRIRLSAANRFLWSWDNGSFLYRVEVVDNTTLRLLNPPPDTAHFPRATQIVELLPSEVRLANNELVAAAQGTLMTLGASYNPDTQTITLPSAIPANLIPPGATPRLFVRFWEQEVTFTSGSAQTLAATGLRVTITAPAGIHTGDFWAFAVRPGAPTQVLQKRYLDAPQPPEGPQIRVCPLGIVSWSAASGAGSLVADCREHFDNLVELTKRKGGNGCCTVTVQPEQADSIDNIIAALPDNIPIKICLAPGVYNFRGPLRLRRSDVTFEACPGGVVFTALDPSNAFRMGMILLIEVSSIKFEGIEFRLPVVRVGPRPLLTLSTAELTQLGLPRTEELSVSIGIRAIQTSGVEVHNCTFFFPFEFPSASHFAAGIFAAGRNGSWVVRKCSFGAPRTGPVTGGNQPSIGITADTFFVRVGFVLTHSIAAQPVDTPGAGPALRGELAPAVLSRAEFVDNRFSGMSANVFVQARTTEVRITGNSAVSIYSGFWLLTAHALTTLAQTMTQDHKVIGSHINDKFFFNDPVLKLISSIARSLETPDIPGTKLPFNPVGLPAAGPFPPVVANDLNNRFHRLFTWLSAIEAAAFEAAQASSPRYDVLSNLVECDPGITLQNVPSSGPAVVLWCDDFRRVNGRENTGSQTVTGNQTRGSIVLQPLVIAIMATEAAFTGNLVMNESQVNDGKRSALVFPGTPPSIQPRIAVTGNVLHGALAVPARPVPAPLNTWDVLNTVFFT